MEMTNCLRYARMFNRLLNCWKFSLRFTNGVRRNKARYCPRLGDYKTKQQTVTRQISCIELNKHLPIEGGCPNTMPPTQKRSVVCSSSFNTTSVIAPVNSFYFLKKYFVTVFWPPHSKMSRETRFSCGISLSSTTSDSHSPLQPHIQPRKMIQKR